MIATIIAAVVTVLSLLFLFCCLKVAGRADGK